MSSSANTLGTADVDNDAPDALVIAERLAAHVAGALTPYELGNSTFTHLPDGYQLKDLTEAIEKSNPNRSRPQGVVHLGDVGSLLQYCKDQMCSERGYIYADIDTRVITAVFNDQRSPLTPGWRDHRATFHAAFTPEFKNWVDHNGKQMSQQEFAEFIEDNIADLPGSDGPNLLQVATTIQATSGINFSSARRLQDGQTQLTYNEVINTTAGENGALTIPQTFALGVRIFKNGEGYKLAARLKYRLNSGKVLFWYELDRHERAVEDAFAGYVATVRADSGYQVLLGKP